MEVLKAAEGFLGPDGVELVKTVGFYGLAWASLELIGYVLLRPYFIMLLESNQKLAGNQKAKGKTATQMLPRVVCFVHNALQIPLALYVLTDPAFYSGDNRMLASSEFSTLVMAISAGYFLYDTIECIVRFEHEGPEFLLHGVFCFIVFTSLTYCGKMHFFGAGFLMWELSTPFMHFRWFLYKIAKDKGRLYLLNGMVALCTFFLCRICWGPILSLLFWKDSLRILATPLGARLSFPLVTLYRVCTVVMNGLNMYWFEKMVRLAFDAAGGGERKRKKAA